MSTKRDAGRHVYSFQDYKCTPDPLFALEAECVEKPIVVDNGSYQCRAGWACGASRFEQPLLVFRSAAARSRGAARSESHVGNDISNLEPLRWTLKSAFDRNALVNCDIQELVFDYIFTHLGINTQVTCLSCSVYATNCVVNEKCVVCPSGSCGSSCGGH